jgi:hypothetical protein
MNDTERIEMLPRSTRRDFLGRTGKLTGLAAAAGWNAALGAAERAPALELSTFSAEVTPPLGHALMGGGIAPAAKIVDPLFARGIVLRGVDKPVVLVSVEWCELRNDAFARWRSVLAEAAGTTPERVLVSCVHVHDAPIADLAAQRLLEERRATGSICDLEFHERAVQRVAQALGASLTASRRVTQLGVGQASVANLASNRRYLLPDGKPTFGRTSSTRDALAHAAPEGTIDPLLRTLSFWDEERPVAVWHVYAIHPMSYYGKGGVSSDFVGMARQRFADGHAGVFTVYASGCSGNVTAGKFNDGAPANRPVLAERLARAMEEAWRDTRRHPLQSCAFRNVTLRLEPRSTAGFSLEELRQRLRNDPKPFGQCLAALGLSWRQRAEAGARMDVPSLDFGPARLLLLPAEAYVEFQLYAQQQAKQPVITLGYGECAPGYIPSERAWDEGDSNLGDWCWVGRGAEAAMKQVIRGALA